MKLAAQIICTAALAGLFSWALLVGMEREVLRQHAHTQAMCKNYGVAMNSWARQNNLTPPCAE